MTEGEEQPPRPAWIAVHTLPRQEFVVEAELWQEPRYRTFCPWLMETVRHWRNGLVLRTSSEKRPFFSRYLFVLLGPGDSVWRVAKTRGVASVVAVQGRPLVVPDKVMARLLEIAQEDGYIPQERKEVATAKYRPGDAVRLTLGPYADLVTQVASVDRDGRICVWLDALGGRRAVRVEHAGVKLVE